MPEEICIADFILGFRGPPRERQGSQLDEPILRQRNASTSLHSLLRRRRRRSCNVLLRLHMFRSLQLRSL